MPELLTPELLTKELPGIGGVIRQEPEDFFVEEIPLYQPCGSGEHLYLSVEKRGLTTYDLLRELAQALGCKEREIGYAGLKDAKAVTRQTVSIPQRQPSDVAKLDIAGVRILSAALHSNKLRPGHLAGNYFRIRIRKPLPEALTRTEAILKQLSQQGVANRFGEQRYGVLGNSSRIGQAILKVEFETAVKEIIGDPQKIAHPGWKAAAQAYRRGELAEAVEKLPRHCRPERQLLTQLQAGNSHSKSVLAMPRKLLRLYLSAYQSSLFDRLVDLRIDSIGTIQTGDLAYKHANSASFLVTDAAVEQVRADTFEISPTGPLFGRKVKLAEGESGQLEQQLLQQEGLTLEAFRLSGGLSMDGERRPLRVPLAGAACQQEGSDLMVCFSLPKGSFATTVLDEIMKTATAT
ncbi:MAG: tRNA pseudouridine(13) synthase TruD [Desulfuromonadales bacterium]|nr:tRNA pseudouridine(13) synthase TruD [Desulfuromonadales bacterium]